MTVHAHRFTGKVALVTGGGSGIGRATAGAFAREGAVVVVAGRRAEPLAETVALISDEGGKAEAVVADVTREDDVVRLVEAVVARHGALDVAFNNAGVSGSGKQLHEYDVDTWDRVSDTNLKAMWLCMKHEVSQMLERGGAIVNMASIAGVVGYLHAAPYTASKHGVVGLTRSAAIDYGRCGIRVNAVCPGPVLTPMLEQARAARGPSADDFYIRNTPLGRFCRPDEVANAVIWLASDEASFVTGQALGIDGGWCAQ